MLCYVCFLFSAFIFVFVFSFNLLLYSISFCFFVVSGYPFTKLICCVLLVYAVYLCLRLSVNCLVAVRSISMQNACSVANLAMRIHQNYLPIHFLLAILIFIDAISFNKPSFTSKPNFVFCKYFMA